MVWILSITQLLNLVFCDEQLIYPVIWCYNKLVVLFKKGMRLCCGNWRGLSIGDTLGKLYAKILSCRLNLWMHIDIGVKPAVKRKDDASSILQL